MKFHRIAIYFLCISLVVNLFTHGMLCCKQKQHEKFSIRQKTMAENQDNIETIPSPDSHEVIPSNLLNNILAKQKFIFYEIFPFLDFLELEIKIKFISKEIYTLYTDFIKMKEQEKEAMKKNGLTNEELFLKALKHPLYAFFRKTKVTLNVSFDDYRFRFEYEKILDFPSLIDTVNNKTHKYPAELVILPKTFKQIHHIVSRWGAQSEYKVCLLTNGQISILKKNRTGENFFWTNLANHKIEKLKSSSDQNQIYFQNKNIIKIKILSKYGSIGVYCRKNNSKSYSNFSIFYSSLFEML